MASHCICVWLRFLFFLILVSAKECSCRKGWKGKWFSYLCQNVTEKQPEDETDMFVLICSILSAAFCFLACWEWEEAGMFGFSLLVEKALKGYTRALFGTKTLQHTFQILMRYTDCTCSLVVCVMQKLRLRSLSVFRWVCGISMPPCVPCDIPVVSCTSVPWYMRFITLKFFRIKCWLLYFCNPSICSLFLFSPIPLPTCNAGVRWRQQWV